MWRGDNELALNCGPRERGVRREALLRRRDAVVRGARAFTVRTQPAAGRWWRSSTPACTSRRRSTRRWTTRHWSRSSVSCGRANARRGRPTDRGADAVGLWTTADWQFVGGHHVAAGVELMQAIAGASDLSMAPSAHYAWYFATHSRLRARMAIRRPRLVEAWHAALAPVECRAPAALRGTLPRARPLAAVLVSQSLRRASSANRVRRRSAGAVTRFAEARSSRRVASTQPHGGT